MKANGSKVSASKTPMKRAIPGGTIRTAAAGARVQLDSANGLQGLDASGTVMTQLTTGGILTAIGATIKSAATGQRIELSGGSIKGYDSSGNIIWSITDAGVWTFNDGALSNDAFDQAGYDFQFYPEDTSVHDLDLSSIIPAGFRSVLLRVTLMGGSQPPTISFRKKGNSNWINAARLSAPSGGAVLSHGDLQVAMNTSRVIEYKVENYYQSYVRIVVGECYK